LWLVVEVAVVLAKPVFGGPKVAAAAQLLIK
jgi:hypothetical protein